MVSAEDEFALLADSAWRAVYRVLTNYGCRKAGSQFKHAASSRTINKDTARKFAEHF
jgi:hypothetical protein